MNEIKTSFSINNIEDLTKDNLCTFLNLKQDDFKNFAAIMDIDNDNIKEIFLLEASDDKKVKKILENMKNYVNCKSSQAAGYNLNHKKTIDKNIIFSKGNFCFMILIENSDKIKEKILNLL